MKPIQHNIYKGTSGKFGAIQFSLLPSHWVSSDPSSKVKVFGDNPVPPHDAADDSEMIQKDGCIFVHAASAVGPNKYDWDNKIVFALSLTDIGKLLVHFKNGQDLSLFHDPGAQSTRKGEVTKTMKFSSPKGIVNGAFINLVMNAGGKTTTHSIPLTVDELAILDTLLRAAVPKMLAWN